MLLKFLARLYMEHAKLLHVDHRDIKHINDYDEKELQVISYQQKAWEEFGDKMRQLHSEHPELFRKCDDCDDTPSF